MKLAHKYTIIGLWIIIICSMFATNSYAKWIVNIGWSGEIQDIVSINVSNRLAGGDLQNTLYYLAEKVVKFVRLLLNGIALLAMLYVGYLWVTSMGNEEKTSDGKNRIILIVLWLFLVNASSAIYGIFTGSDYMYDGFGNKIDDSKGYLSINSNLDTIRDNSEKCNFLFCPRNFMWTSLNSIVTMLEIIMIVVAIVMFTIGGFMMLLGWRESASETAKKRLSYWVIALVITGILEAIYRAIYFQSGLENIEIKTTSVLIQWAKFFMYLAGPIAIIYIIIGGYYFITSWGDEERADKGKKILTYTAFATIMLLLGYTFIMEIVGLKLF